MNVALLELATTLTLASVFAAAGVAKLADLEGTRTAVGAFGAPRRLIAVLALALPAAELGVALLLLVAPMRAIGAAGALVLLGIFSAAIAVSLARGRTPDCHCFGQLHSAPTGPKTLVRNGCLIVLAGLTLTTALRGDAPSAIAWAGDIGAIAVLGLALGLTIVALVAAGVVAFVKLLSSYGRVLLRLDDLERRLADAGIDLRHEAAGAAPELGLDPGTPAPAFVARDVAGEDASLEDLMAPGLPLLLLFTSPGCGPCKELLPDVAAWQHEYADRLVIAIATGGDHEEAAADAKQHGLANVLPDSDLEIYGAYRAAGTPSAVLIGVDGAIASHVAAGSDWIKQLLVGAVAAPEEAEESDASLEGLPVGSLAPDLALRDLDSQPIPLALVGEQTLVLFWNPDCGFCGSMRDDLLGWERATPTGAPRLVVVSSGDEASTRAEGFSSPVHLDEGFAVGAAFEASGTPMAVLIDGDGRVASPLAAGAEGVFALAGGRSRADQTRFPQLRDQVAP